MAARGRRSTGSVVGVGHGRCTAGARQVHGRCTASGVPTAIFSPTMYKSVCKEWCPRVWKSSTTTALPVISEVEAEMRRALKWNTQYGNYHDIRRTFLSDFRSLVGKLGAQKVYEGTPSAEKRAVDLLLAALTPAAFKDRVHNELMYIDPWNITAFKKIISSDATKSFFEGVRAATPTISTSDGGTNAGVQYTRREHDVYTSSHTASFSARRLTCPICTGSHFERACPRVQRTSTQSKPASSVPTDSASSHAHVPAAGAPSALSAPRPPMITLPSQTAPRFQAVGPPAQNTRSRSSTPDPRPEPHAVSVGAPARSATGSATTPRPPPSATSAPRSVRWVGHDGVVTEPDGVILVPTAEGQDIGVHFKVDTGACNSMIARANVQQLIDANAVCREQRLEQPILLQSAFAAQPPTRGSASMPSSSTTEAYAGHCLWRF